MTLRRIIAAGSGERGAIAPFAAIVLAVTIGLVALSTDLGSWFAQRRNLQAATDAAALAAVSDTRLLAAEDRAAIVANATDLLRRNGGETPTIRQADLGVYCAYAAEPPEPGSGSTLPQPPRPRFSTVIGLCDGDGRPADDAVPNAVRLQAASTAPTFLSRVLAPTEASLSINTTATAARIDEAAFQAGTGLADLNDGIANALLRALLGSSVQLTLAQYDGLLQTDVKLLPFLDALATNLNLAAGTYDGLLQSSAQVADIVRAAIQVLNQQGQLAGVQLDALNALLALQGQITTPNDIQLGDLIDLGVWKPQPIGSPDPKSALDVGLNLYQLVTFSAQLASGNNAVAIPKLGLDLGPILSISLEATAIEPPQKPYLTFGPVGAEVHTAQVRLKLMVKLGNLPILLGKGVQLPIYIEIGEGDARLSEISCGPNPATDAVVTVNARSGVAAIYIGAVDNNAMRNFARPVTVEKADLVDVNLLGIFGLANIKGKAKVSLGSSAETPLTFTQPQPGVAPVSQEPPTTEGVIGPVSGGGQRARAVSADMGKNLGSDLYDNLEITANLFSGLLSADVDLKSDGAVCLRLLVIPLCVASAKDARDLLGALAGLLSVLDNLLDPLVQALGLQFGYIDVSVTGVRCGVPVLVQ